MDDHKQVYEAILSAQQQGEPTALATIIDVSGSVPRHTGSKMLVRANGSIVGTVGGGALESLIVKEALVAISDGKTRTPSYRLNDLKDGDPGICGGTVTVFIEPLDIAVMLLVIGGGHVGKALAELGKWAGYRVWLCDDRAEYCNAEYAPGLDRYIICPPGQITQHISINARTYIAATTRGMPVDMNLIPSLLATDAPYIGVIGSRRRWALTAKALQAEKGLSEVQLARVRAPIGLELQAETPKEIALSIMAEITMLRRGGSGQPMQWMGELEAASTTEN
jgi:xanthine dehydrogenase accessory factor